MEGIFDIKAMQIKNDANSGVLFVYQGKISRIQHPHTVEEGSYGSY